MDLMTDWQNEDARRASGAMLRQMFEDLRINHTQAARYLGVSLRTMRRFTASRKSLAPTSMILLLRLMIKHGECAVVPEKMKRKKR